jgi:hypothetical protein
MKETDIKMDPQQSNESKEDQDVEFVKIAEAEGEETVELPVESKGYILISTVTAQFPGACGLKYKTEQSSWRGFALFFNNHSYFF